MAAPTDPGLFARAMAGDDAAFAELVRPYQRPVFRHCYRMLGSGADAEDATQDTLEWAWRKLATHDGSGPFGAWLQRIATNLCLDGLRARRRRIGPSGYGPPAAPGAMPAPPDPELAWVEPASASDLRGSADPQDEVVRREDISLAFVAARPHGVRLVAGSCNGQPAFATYQPDGQGGLVASGLQVLQAAETGGRVLVTALVSYRDPGLVSRCGLPSSLPLPAL